MDVGEWLRGIGLGQYEATFREHEIDAEVLPELTEADLEKFGVPFGHRKRLIKAIAKLGNAAPEQPAAAPRQPAASSPPPRTFRPDAERRPITVMFCDLVGSTSLAAKLDAEDWRNLVNAYLDEASKAVAAFGGHVLKRLGDGLMALFGYPAAQENDAERAVRAALAIQRALSEINTRNAATCCAGRASASLIAGTRSPSGAAHAPPIPARIAITAVLHTWGSTLTHHPHAHMIVPGGGLSLDGARWVASRSNFLVHVKRKAQGAQPRPPRAASADGATPASGHCCKVGRSQRYFGSRSARRRGGPALQRL
jgi:hypothetical protein